jgi:acyl-[acyl-carrier-protein]-phospholipid O-acyltransferase / long-chain-fatty-acid--[acyl-carrier-protein] ligase
MTQTAEAAAPSVAEPPCRSPMPPLPAAWRSTGRAFFTTARRRGSAVAVADSSGASLSYRDALIRTLALSRALSRSLDANERVGVMLPPSAPGVVLNLALAMLGKVSVNLNYTGSQESVDSSVRQAGLTHVVTANKMLMKVPIRPAGKLLILEELAKQVTAMDKAWAALVALLVPSSLLGAFLQGLKNESLGAPATIIFTSGSTGDPKGVVLTHGNVLSNVTQIQAQVKLAQDEVMLGILPFFHSFGYTVTIWTALCLGLKAVYHNNPLDGRTVGKLCHDHKATILFGSPTFMRGYLKKCDREQFASVRLLILGAEKLKFEVAQQIRDQFGIEPLEGYGCTETGPVVAVNTPEPQRTADGRLVDGNRPGTIGLPLPGTAVTTLNIETGERQDPATEGIIAVKGPQVMPGYLNQPEATAKVLRDGWYSTGDLGYVDADGFVKITDRLNRFSKIAGEMVPHLAVETAVQERSGATDLCVAVTALPDLKRGERLVVLYTPDMKRTPAEICHELAAGPMPKLWLPSPDDFVQVDDLPVLGTGKIDLRRLRTIAEERLGAS